MLFSPFLFNPRIPLLESSSNCFAFGTASIMCSALIYENHPNVEKNMYFQNWNPYYFLFDFVLLWHTNRKCSQLK